MDYSNLFNYGLNNFFLKKYLNIISQNNQFTENNCQLARIISVHRNLCRIIEPEGEQTAYVAAKIQFGQKNCDQFPAAGDWVIVEHPDQNSRGFIKMVLPRQTKFSRNSFDRKRLNSKAQEQIIAANIDKTFIVNALNQDFNLSRMERYLIIVWDSGSVPYLICVMKLRKNLGRLIKLAWVLKFG